MVHKATKRKSIVHKNSKRHRNRRYTKRNKHHLSKKNVFSNYEYVSKHSGL